MFLNEMLESQLLDQILALVPEPQPMGASAQWKDELPSHGAARRIKRDHPRKMAHRAHGELSTDISYCCQESQPAVSYYPSAEDCAGAPAS